MRTVVRFGVLAVIVLWAALSPAGAQVQTGDQGVLGEAQGAPVARHNPYTPPPCVAGVPFADVTCTTFYDAWIEQFAADGITAGCGGGDYCPNENVTRAQMAVFIEAAMHWTANWSPGDLGGNNTGAGSNALYANTTGYENTGVGAYSLYNNTIGYSNTAVGNASLYDNTTGTGNTAIGFDADVAAGNLFDATAIGNNAIADASHRVRIGDGSVTQIGGNVAWSNLSDIRAKTDIVPLDLGLGFVMALRPVSFTLKQGNGRTDMGFVAQDVEALLSDDYNVLGIGGDAARTLSLRYTDFIAPMVKAIQEQQAQLESQKATITAQQAKIESQQSEVEALRARINSQDARLAALEARIGAGGK